MEVLFSPYYANQDSWSFCDVHGFYGIKTYGMETIGCRPKGKREKGF